MGYSIALCMEAIGTCCLSACGTPVVCSMVGCCWLLKAFIVDITNDLVNVEANDIFYESMDQNEIVEHFNGTLKSFMVVKQLSCGKYTNFLVMIIEHIFLFVLLG